MIEKRYIDDIMERVDLAEVASGYGISLKATGHHLFGLCPFHQERTPSFSINTGKNLWYCHGCGKGGNVITFVMEMENISFPQAVRKLMREKLGQTLPDEAMQSTPEEEAEYKKLEAMRIINERLCTFFFEQLQTDNDNAKAAKSYMLGRWDEKYCEEQRIGYAPDDWSSVADFAGKAGLSIELMLEMGILKKSEKTGSLYCMFRNRLMIPIRDRYGNIEGFIARALDDKSECKYVNSSDSELYHKSQSVFGIDGAVTKARTAGKLYLVEGAPDVMRLQSLGIPNAIASLGGSWTEKQFRKLKDHSLQDCTLCFIPDSDVPKNVGQLGAGFKNVLRNGELAMRQGFTVSVMEIPNDLSAEQPRKIDPDEFFRDKADLAKLTEREFLLWAFGKRLGLCATAEEKQKLIKETCELLVLIKNDAVQDRYVAGLAKMDGNKTIWRQTLNTVKARTQKQIAVKGVEDDADTLAEYGFLIRQGCYYGLDKKGNEVQWSNFTLKPLFHIKDDLRPVRLFEIRNNDPGSKSETVELDMDAFTSAKQLRKKLLGIGNYTWLAGEEALIKLQRYLAKVTETAVEVKQLGWQRKGFFCFCNGAQEDGRWHPVDVMGIVRLKVGIFYLPAMSELYRDSTELFTNERRFRHRSSSAITLHEYLSKIVEVFGDNAKVGICFYLATLFRDIILSKTRFFPLLNIFGPKGSGKTELAETLMSFFTTGNEPQNIETSTLPALADCVAGVSNALVHIDEYKNGIDIKKVEWLKDLWGAIGRSRMNMDKDKKREQARVDSGVIITGQEMATADIALFSRLIYLTYERQHHTEEERARFADLLRFRQMGATHITLEILGYRDRFRERFENAWKKAETDVSFRLKGREVIDRIERNWLVPLAACIALEGDLQLPFCYGELLRICTDGIIRQNDLCARTDEISCFWTIISSAHQKGRFMHGQDYLIKSKGKLKTNIIKDGITFSPQRTILMIRKNISLAIYQEIGSQIKARLLPSESILHYLQTTTEYYGQATVAERFRKFTPSGTPVQEQVTDGDKMSYHTLWQKDRPLCFDYAAVCEKYDINLDSMTEEQMEGKEDKPTEEVLPF